MTGLPPERKIVFQGEPGANSHVACRTFFPDLEAVPCATFEDCFQALEDRKARYGMIPVENSVAGRVADIHHLLPDADLHAIGERFLPIRHQLMGVKGAKLSDLKTAHSHVMALGQCRKALRELNLIPTIHADTAGSAREVAAAGDKTRAAIASDLAAEIYGLDILKANIEDAAHNTTRFLILSKDPITVSRDEGPLITSFLFRVRNVPAALYKAMGGFATNGVNMTKLESYQLNGSFFASQFYADVEGHPEDRPVKLALEELAFFSAHLKIVGTYPADPFRRRIAEAAAAAARNPQAD